MKISIHTYLDAMPTSETQVYKGYKLVKLTNGWWRVVGQSNQEPTIEELKAYIDKMIAARDSKPRDIQKISVDYSKGNAWEQLLGVQEFYS